MRARLGQHFLKDRGTLEKIIRAADLNRDDIVLEIGAGTGELTEALSQQVKWVIAVEKDRELCELLKKKFSAAKNLHLVCGDILNFEPIRYTLIAKRYKVVANIPYYITGRLLRLMFESWPKPQKAVLMLQKEVAERIVAKPPRMNRLAAIVQYFAKPRIAERVSKSAFSPPPKVNSVIIVLDFPKNGVKKDPKVARLISTGFTHPRKYLSANLKSKFSRKIAEEALRKMAFLPSIRPAELSPSDWERLSTLLYRK